MKHVGIIENIGRRCIVVFRQIYDEKGNILEPDNCLVTETDSLPDYVHQDIMSIVESEPAQRTGNLYEVLARTRLSDGSISLSWLAANGRLKKVKTSNVMLAPDSNTKIKLSKINRIIELEKSGYTQRDIERIIQDDTDDAPRKKERIDSTNYEEKLVEQVTPAVDNVLTDKEIAQNLLNQADHFTKEAARLKEEAYRISPDLNPENLKPKKRTTTLKKPKEPAVEK